MKALVESPEADGCDEERDCRPSRDARQNISCCARPKGRLRALATKCACQVCRSALLKEHDSDQNEAHKYVHDDDDVEKDMHFLSCPRSLSGWPGVKESHSPRLRELV